MSIPDQQPDPRDSDRHAFFMDRALALAEAALARGDWPVAAVIVRDGAIVAEGSGRQNTSGDATSHAELNALRNAASAGVDVAHATLYCTMEPCPMCAWALRLRGIDCIVLGARHADLNRTDLGRYSIEAFAAMMGYRLQLVEGVRRAECVALRRRWGQDVADRQRGQAAPSGDSSS